MLRLSHQLVKERNKPVSNDLKVAIIGLDTSHSVELLRRMKAPDCPADQRVPGL